MTNKVYEIRRIDMKNLKEYLVWKHANEEIWEVCDEKSFTGNDSLIMVETRKVMEFDYNGQHYRIYRKKADSFAEVHGLAIVVYQKFTEDDFVRITFKDSETDVTPAATLPKGWNWVEKLDESGYLESPDGKPYFLYEVQYANKCERIVHHGLYNNVSVFYVNPDDIHNETLLQKFKSYAETQVYVINH